MNNTTVTGHGVTEQQRADYERDGYLVVRQLLNAGEVEAIRNRFDAIAEKGEAIEGHWKPDLTPAGARDPLMRYPRVMMPHRFDELSKRHLLDPRIHDLVAGLLGEEPVASQTMFYYKPPGAKGQALHQDNFYLHVKPTTCMAAWIAIDPATPENGGLYVVPGTHKLDVLCPDTADGSESFTTHLVKDPLGRKAIPVKLDSGDVLFFNGSLIHGSPPNRSKTIWRRSFICHYVPKGATQVSKWYFPLLDFEGHAVPIPESTDGGPCGKEFASVGSYGKWH